MKNRRHFIFLVVPFIFAVQLYASQLKLIRTIVPEEPVCVWKVIVYKNSIYLLFNNERTVILMNKKGEILQRISRKGEGPGEFKYLSDFTICNDRLLMCGGKRINIFSIDGKLLKSLKQKYTIYNVFSSGTDWFYTVKHSSPSENKKSIIYYFSVYNSLNQCLHKIPDETVQRAYHPKRGNNMPFPWFPSPFCNRPFFQNGGEKKAAIFMSRREYFYYIVGKQLVKTQIKAPLKPGKVTPKDLESFFEKITPRPSFKTKKSVVYPEYKQFFIGAFKWDEAWALVTEKSLIIIDENGHYRQTIPLPEIIKKNISDNGYSNGIFFKAEELYCIKDNEVILVFSLH